MVETEYSRKCFRIYFGQKYLLEKKFNTIAELCTTIVSEMRGHAYSNKYVICVVTEER